MTHLWLATLLHTPCSSGSHIQIFSYSGHWAVFSAVANLINLPGLSSEAGVRVPFPEALTQLDIQALKWEAMWCSRRNQALKSEVCVYASSACCMLAEDEGLFLSHRASVTSSTERDIERFTCDLLEHFNEINDINFHSHTSSNY